jgi:hypothetical protein
VITIPDFSRYVPPGVYVEDNSDPIVTSSGLPASVVAIIGPALGYQTASETLQIYATTGVVLAQRGIFTTAVTGPPAIAAPVVKKLDGTLLAENTDYAFTVDSSGGGGAANAVITIQRIANSPNIADGDTVVIAYAYADTTYYAPQLHEDYDTILAVYGLPMVSAAPTNPNTSPVASPLSLGAKVAIENGANPILTIATNPNDGDLRAQFQAAYAKIATNYSTTLVVPILPDDLTVNTGTVSTFVQQLAQDLKSHCENASAGGYARIGFFGCPRNYSETDLSQEALAGSLSSKRLALLFPHNLSMFNSSTNQVGEVCGSYLAAAAVGKLSSLPTAYGLTKQSLGSFQGIPTAVSQRMTKAYKDSLSGSGVMVAEIDRLNRLSVRHGVATNMSALNTREISMTRIADTLYAMVQLGMEAADLIGAPIDAEMTSRVKAALTSILEQAVLSEVIVGYTDLKVRQQTPPSGDPSVIECKFAYQPAVPLNYIVVQFQLNLVTGEINDETATDIPVSA